MDLATMSTLEIIGLGFLIWVAVIVGITAICLIYINSEKIKYVVGIIAEALMLNGDYDEYDPEWMDYESWKELTP